MDGGAVLVVLYLLEPLPCAALVNYSRRKCTNNEQPQDARQRIQQADRVVRTYDKPEAAADGDNA